MNHLIVRSHLGTNFELIENFLKQDNDFFRFIYEDDPKLFIEQYQQDVADGLVINQIDIEETKNNWKSFFEIKRICSSYRVYRCKRKFNKIINYDIQFLLIFIYYKSF